MYKCTEEYIHNFGMQIFFSNIASSHMPLLNNISYVLVHNYVLCLLRFQLFWTWHHSLWKYLFVCQVDNEAASLLSDRVNFAYANTGSISFAI